MVSFWGVKIHFRKKYAWFAVEILIHGSKSCLLDMLWSQKGIKKSLLIVDMPKNSYSNANKAEKNAKLIMKSTGCDAVKIESDK